MPNWWLIELITIGSGLNSSTAARLEFVFERTVQKRRVCVCSGCRYPGVSTEEAKGTDKCPVVHFGKNTHRLQAHPLLFVSLSVWDSMNWSNTDKEPTHYMLLSVIKALSVHYPNVHFHFGPPKKFVRTLTPVFPRTKWCNWTLGFLKI